LKHNGEGILKRISVLLIVILTLVLALANVMTSQAHGVTAGLDLDIINPQGGRVLYLNPNETVNVTVRITNNATTTSGNVILACGASLSLRPGLFQFDAFAPTGPIVSTNFGTNQFPFVQVWALDQKQRAFAPAAVFNGTLTVTGNVSLRNTDQILCALLEETASGLRLVERESLRVARSN
jgi:hypothetical protein